MRILLVFLLLAGAAEAQQKAVRVNIATPGDYVILVDSAGNVAISVLPTIAVGGGVVVPPVVPPIVPPVVPPVVSRAAEVKAEVEKIPVNDSRHQSAIKLTAMYRFIAANVRNNTIPQANIGQAINAYLGFLLAGDNRWGAVNAKITGYLATCASPGSCADVLEESANGILESVPEPLRDDADEIDIPENMQAMGMDAALAGKSEKYGINWETLFALLLKLLPIILAMFSAVEAYLPCLILLA